MNRIKTLTALIITLSAAAMSATAARTDSVRGGAYVFATEVKPLITSLWGQGAPYNSLCPKEKVTDSTWRHAYAGCGPMVMSQVMRHMAYPKKAALPGAAYRWDLMFDRVTDSTTTAQKDAVARLIRDCGTAANTLYGQSASSTKLTDLVMALKKYFALSRYMHIADRHDYRGPEGDKAWKDLIYGELSAGRPVIFRGEKGSWNAHVFVIDGCRDSTVHVNWGWNGLRNGYYNPDTLYGYSANQRMVVGIAPEGHKPQARHIDVRQPGTLHKYITDADRLTLRHLRLSGSINADDIELLNQLAGGASTAGRRGVLATIDMSHAVILTLPKGAFRGCRNLTYISLPITLPEISAYAFYRCTCLNTVVVPPMVGEIKSNAFTACFNLTGIQLPLSLTKIGPYAFNSCNSLTAVQLPQSVRTVERGAFAYAQRLESLTVPKGATIIGKDVVKGTKVKKIKRY